MELTVSLQIKIDDDKVFNALPQDMQEAVEHLFESHKASFTDPDRHVPYLKEARSNFISDYARRHFGDFWEVNKVVDYKGLGIDLNDEEVISQKFRGDN